MSLWSCHIVQSLSAEEAAVLQASRAPKLVPSHAEASTTLLYPAAHSQDSLSTCSGVDRLWVLYRCTSRELRAYGTASNMRFTREERMEVPRVHHTVLM